MLPLDIDAHDTRAMDRDVLADLLDIMDTAEGREQVDAARDVLKLDAANLEAYVVLAGHAETTAEALALLREAIRIGNRRWAPGDEADDVAWWRDAETRPFMRAILAYGNVLAEAGLRDEAADCFRALRDMRWDGGVPFSLEEVDATLPGRRR